MYNVYCAHEQLLWCLLLVSHSNVPGQLQYRNDLMMLTWLYVVQQQLAEVPTLAAVINSKAILHCAGLLPNHNTR